MARRPRTSPESTAPVGVLPEPELLEATQMVDPHAMDHTRILDPHAADDTKPGLAAGPVPESRIDPLPERPVLSLSPVVEKTPRGPFPWKPVVGVAASAVLVVGAWYGVSALTASAPQGTTTAKAEGAVVPSGYEQVMEKAQAGDVSAMRTLAAVYTYGLGTPANREEGLRWYHRAAEAGSKVAREELKQLESTVR